MARKDCGGTRQSFMTAQCAEEAVTCGWRTSKNDGCQGRMKLEQAGEALGDGRVMVGGESRLSGAGAGCATGNSRGGRRKNEGAAKRPASRRGEEFAVEGGRARRACFGVVMGDEVVVAERGSQHGEALALGGEGPITNPDRLDGAASKVGDCGRLLPRGVPNASFALVDLRAVPQGTAEGIVERTDHVDVIKEGEDGLAVAELTLQVTERVVLR